MRKLAGIVLVVLLGSLLLAGSAFATGAPPDNRTCDDVLPLGIKTEGPGTPTTVITAPAGKVFDQVCVKAGSANQGLGPELFSGCAGLTTCTISHSSGKDISHWSYTTKTPTPTVTPTLTPTPTTTEEPEDPTPTPTATPKPKCELTPKYWQDEFYKEGQPICYLITWDKKDDGTYWPANVRSQLCNCGWIADHVIGGGYVYQDCDGNYWYDGKIWQWYKPDMVYPNWKLPCASGGGGGECLSP